MGIPSASYSITMRVHLGADPLGIGRITTAVGEAAGTVVAVDIVESHPDSLVVDLTCNAADARHADAITRAVSEVDGARVHNVSARNLSFLHFPPCSPDEAVLAQPAASGVGRKGGWRQPGRRPTSVPHRCAGSVGRSRWEHYAHLNAAPAWCCRALPTNPGRR
jgi:hypothetical protein